MTINSNTQSFSSLNGAIKITQISQSESSSTSSSSSTTTTEPVKEQTPEELNEQLKREIASFNKPFDNTTYDGTVDAIQMERNFLCHSF